MATGQMAELVAAVRGHAEAHAETHGGWRAITTYTDEELTGVLLVGCTTLTQALRTLAPIVSVYAGFAAPPPPRGSAPGNGPGHDRE